MQSRYEHKLEFINYLLIISTLLHCSILFASAINLERSLSLAGLAHQSDSTDFKNRVEDPLQYADDSLITRSGKPNKVSKLLRLIHNRAGAIIHRRKDGIAEPVADPGGTSDQAEQFSQMSDDEVITKSCEGHSSITCRYAVKAAIKARPEHKAVIANAIRHKPAYVHADKLLYHKLFEAAIACAEQKNLDEKIDIGINLLAKKNPYGWMATKALDLASSKV